MRFALALALLLGGAADGRSAEPEAALPSFAELEAAGATVGEVRILAQDIFDLDDPREDKPLFRWANRLHIQTRPAVIERMLLFRRGDPVSARVIEETERLLHANRFLYDARIRPLAVRDGVVDIEVATRDTWSLDPGVSVGRSGGANTGSVYLREYNLLGTGTTLGAGHSRNVDRSSNEFEFRNHHLFGSRVSLAYVHAANSDGQRDDIALVRPFYALDARWTAGVAATRDDRIESVYIGGKVVSQFRHRQTREEVFGGWSPGLVGGWVHRLSLGVGVRDDAYASEPGLTAPARLPTDQRLVGPFVRYELIEDRFERELNRNLIGRPEFFALGLASAVQLGRASRSFGSDADAWLYAARVARGFEPAAGQTLIAGARISGQFEGGAVRRQRVGVQAQYYVPQGRRWLFYASADAGLLSRPDPNEVLLLGGDDGLRGYPLRYQSGTRRALFTVEERFYTDIYLWRLFRIGGAAFVDLGRAWGGASVNTDHPGWLGDAGLGLRIVSARSAFGNVIHVDLAFPLDPDRDVKRVQFLVKTKASF